MAFSAASQPDAESRQHGENQEHGCPERGGTGMDSVIDHHRYEHHERNAEIHET